MNIIFQTKCRKIELKNSDKIINKRLKNNSKFKKCKTAYVNGREKKQYRKTKKISYHENSGQ